MWARKRIDIRWSDLASAACWSFLPGDCEGISDRIEKLWSSGGDAIVCLSVRSGFDLLLAELDFAEGDEILFSAITIADMYKIAEAHGLVPVPIDLDIDSLAIDADRVKAAITPRTRAIVAAHLFGGRMSLEQLRAIADEHELLLIEDCAQAFDGINDARSELADVSMFSFGTIKTTSALGGGILQVRNRELLERMRNRQQTYPLQPRGEFLSRVVKYAGLKGISGCLMFGLVVRASKLFGKDYNRMLNQAIRGFSQAEFFALIRRQPSITLLRLLLRRMRTLDVGRIQRRADRGDLLLGAFSDDVEVVGRSSLRNCYWVFGLLADDPPQLIGELAKHGFDATQGGAMTVVPAPSDRPESAATNAALMLEKLVVLPLYPEMPRVVIQRMADVVKSATEQRGIAKSATPRG